MTLHLPAAPAERGDRLERDRDQRDQRGGEDADEEVDGEGDRVGPSSPGRSRPASASRAKFGWKVSALTSVCHIQSWLRPKAG